MSALSQALEALRAGRMVILVDDEGRENEGDLVIAAEHADAAAVAFMAVHGRGLICLALPPERVDALGLPPMVARNDAPRQTAFTISIEARTGVETGISAADRARTIAVAADPTTTGADLVSPGHVFPLRAVPGGVLARNGHTEGSIDLALLAGFSGPAVICEVMNDDGTMARLGDLEVFGARYDLPIVSIAELQAHLRAEQNAMEQSGVEEIASAKLPSVFSTSPLTARAFRGADGTEHLAITKGDLAGKPVLARVHSECLTGDALGSLRCDCGEQLRAALAAIGEAESGVVVYVRGHEGRGVGLANKIRAYALQDRGLDTVEANEALGLPIDGRDYAVAADILKALQVGPITLMTNNPRKTAALRDHGLTVESVLPLAPKSNPHNAGYLATKRERLGHMLEGLLS
jgi:3,4-dihydroxy 2-butanone 4-phosphate synthase/GTP cyclohydrolase II